MSFNQKFTNYPYVLEYLRQYYISQSLNLQFQNRCTVPTFPSSNAAELGARCYQECL